MSARPGFGVGAVVRLRELLVDDPGHRPWSSLDQSRSHGLLPGDLGVITQASPSGFQVTFGRLGFIDTWRGDRRFDLVESPADD